MKKRLIDLSEGMNIDLGGSTAFATTGCTGELLIGGFDLADMAADASVETRKTKKRKKDEENG